MTNEDKLALLKVAGFRPKKLRFKNGITEYWFIDPRGKLPSERMVCRDVDKLKCIDMAFTKLIGSKQNEMARETSGAEGSGV